MFRGTKLKKTVDYHTELNSDVFGHWLETGVFPSIAAAVVKSDAVSDIAAYHTILDE